MKKFKVPSLFSKNAKAKKKMRTEAAQPSKTLTNLETPVPAEEPRRLALSCPNGLRCDSAPSMSPSRKRRTVLADLVESEQRYVASLRHMLDYYKRPLSSVLSEAELTTIFSISDLIYDFHCTLAAGLLQRVQEPGDGDVQIGSYMLQMVSFLRSYSLYVNNYTNAVGTLSAREEQDGSFAELLRTLRSRATDDGEPLQSLYSYLVMPIQRVPRYLLLLERLNRCTEPGHPDYQAVQQAIAMIAETASYIDDKRAASESKQRMMALSMAVHGVPHGFSVMAGGRTLQRCDELRTEAAGRSKKISAFLLSDGLLLTKPRPRKTRSRVFSPVGTPSPSTSPSRAGTASPSRAGANDCTYQYIDWLSFERPDTVGLVNHGDGRFSISRQGSEDSSEDSSSSDSGSGARVFLLRDDAPDGAQLLPRLCAALGRPLPPIVPLDRRAVRALHGSFILGPSPSTTLPLAAISSSASVPNSLMTARGERGLSPRFFQALVLRPNSSRRGRDSPKPRRPEPLDHATSIAAGFVAAATPPLPQPPLSWADVESDSSVVEQCLVALVPDHRYELGGRQLRPNLLLPPLFMYPELLGAFYQQHMTGRDHAVLFGNTPERKDPVVVTVEATAADLPFRRAVVRSKHGETRAILPPTGGVDDCLAYLQEQCAEVLQAKSPRSGPMRWLLLPPDATPQTVLSPRDARNRWSLAERLAAYDDDQQRMFTQLKIGVVPTKPGDMQQLSDRRLFATSAASPAFQEFLDFLGDTVPLRGYDGFAGGLDTTANMTGTHSVRAELDTQGQRFDIMFHVSTMLPHVDGDEQQLAKKRHIGNDIVVVVFHEDEQPFDPRVFISKMIQVFVVVTKVGSTDEQRPVYRLAFVCKDQGPSLPVLPVCPEFEANDTFRRFLLAKLVNAEATTHQTCPTFASRNRRARTSCLQEIIDVYTPQ